MDFKQTYFNLWAEAWNFLKKYATPGDSEEFWEQLVNESGEIMKEYEDKPECDFVKDLVVAIVARRDLWDTGISGEHMLADEKVV